jgi:hypothetical protein
MVDEEAERLHEPQQEEAEDKDRVRLLEGEDREGEEQEEQQEEELQSAGAARSERVMQMLKKVFAGEEVLLVQYVML